MYGLPRSLLLVLFLFSVVILYPQKGSAQTLDEFNALVARYSANSPAGGPRKNPNAAVFVYLRASRKLCWVADGKIVSVDVQPTKEKDDTMQEGPTPVGEYLIGQRFKHEKHKIDWYKLYPRVEDNSGYYGYTAKTKTGRFAMGLHPGSISEGCVTVKSSADPYDTVKVWKAVRDRLDASTLQYKNDNFTGFLYVADR